MGRAFNTRKKEHFRKVRTAAKGSRIAKHALSHDCAIDFENASPLSLIKVVFEQERHWKRGIPN